MPTPGPPAPSGLAGKKTSDIKLSIGLDILANALSGMFGATAPSLDFVYKNARSVQFTFREVRSVRIDPFVVGNFLAKGDLRASPVVKRYFTGQPDVDAYVVTEVLEAKAIGVVGKKDATTEVVDVPQIQAALGVKVGVAATNSTQTDVTYEGPEYLVFGYRAFSSASAWRTACGRFMASTKTPGWPSRLLPSRRPSWTRAGSSMPRFRRGAVATAGRSAMGFERIPGMDIGYGLISYDADGNERVEADGLMSERLLATARQGPISHVFFLRRVVEGGPACRARAMRESVWAPSLRSADHAHMRTVRGGFNPLLIGLHS